MGTQKFLPITLLSRIRWNTCPLGIFWTSMKWLAGIFCCSSSVGSRFIMLGHFVCWMNEYHTSHTDGNVSESTYLYSKFGPVFDVELFKLTFSLFSDLFSIRCFGFYFLVTKCICSIVIVWWSSEWCRFYFLTCNTIFSSFVLSYTPRNC